MTTDLVRDSIAHLGLDIVAVEPVVEESYSSVVRILTTASGERLVLKLPYARRKLFREMEALRQLRDHLPVPDLIDCWIGDSERSGALLLSMLPGRVITGAVSPSMAYALGQLLGQLHQQRLPRFGEVTAMPEKSPLGWWAVMERRFRQWQSECVGAMPTRLYQKALDHYADLLSSMPDPDGPCWVHSDYRPGNVLVEGSSITGLIDFESARGGSADMDFVKIKKEVWDRQPGTKEAFCQGYISIRPLPDIERTLPFYELHVAFGGIAWCVRRSLIQDPFFHENVAWLNRLLADA